MYTDVQTLPTEVKATLDGQTQLRWMQKYNEVIKGQARGNHRLAMLYAWSSVVDSPTCRLFGAFVSSDRLDKQNDTVNIEKTYQKILTCIERGGTITDTHSNRIVGAFIYADRRPTHTRHNGVYAYGVIFNGEQYHNTVWDAIKRALECPTCRDIRAGTSIGGFALDTEQACENGACHRVINDLSIHEISICQEPANDDAVIDYVNIIAKSINPLPSDGVDMINKALPTVDPRANEQVDQKSGQEMQMQAQQEAQEQANVQQPTQSPFAGQTLGQAVNQVANGGNDGNLPSLDEIRAFKMKIGNAKKFFKEFASIIEMVNSMSMDTSSPQAQGQPQPQQQGQPQAQPQAQAQAQPQAEAPAEEAPAEEQVQKGVIDGVTNAITTGMDMMGNAMTATAHGDIAGIAGMPGQVAGQAASMIPKPEAPKQLDVNINAPAQQQANMAQAEQDATSGDIQQTGNPNPLPEAKPSANPDPLAQAPASTPASAPSPSKAPAKPAAPKPAAPATANAPAPSPVASANAPKPITKDCGCMNTDIHTPVTAKKCPKDKELYGDETEYGEEEFLENKDYDEKASDLKALKAKGDSGMVDAPKIKGEKTADEGPSVEEKEEKKLPEKVLGKAFDAQNLSAFMKAFEDFADALEKCSMTQEQFKAKYDPKPEKAAETSTAPETVEKAKESGMTEKEFKAKYDPKPEKAKDNGKVDFKKYGKEGKEALMKSEEEEKEFQEESKEAPAPEPQGTDDSTLADGNVGEENAEQLIEGAEQMLQGQMGQSEMTAQDLIKLVVGFLQQQGISVQNPPMQNPAIEGEIAKEPSMMEDPTDVFSDPSDMMKASFEGQIAMHKLRLRYIDNRLTVRGLTANDFLYSEQ